jgi:PAS domain S-box-containing protein
MNQDGSQQPRPAPEAALLRARVAELEALVTAQARRIEELERDAARQREAAALLDTLFAAAPAGLAFLDTDLRYVRINASLAEMNGFEPELHLGRTIAEVLPELGPLLEPIFRRILATGEAVKDLEVQGATPLAPGEQRNWLASYYPVRGADGATLGVGLVVVETTEQVRNRAALARLAEQLREQAEMLDLAHVLICDIDSRIISWNKGAEALYGWTAAEAVGRISHELFQTRFPASAEAAITRILAEGAWEGELTHRCKDGREVIVASHQVLHRDAAGRPARILEVNNDVTALKRAEQQLREREQLLALANDAAELGTWRHDLASQMFRLDARAREHHGLAVETIALADLLARIHPDDLPRLGVTIAGAAMNPHDLRRRDEWRVLLPDGTLRWLSINSRVYPRGVSVDHPGGFAVGTSQDITAQKRAEEELRRAAERLRMLHTVDRAILSAHTPAQIAEVVAERLPQLVACDRVVVLTFDEDAERLLVLALHDVDEERRLVQPTVAVTAEDFRPPYAIGRSWYVRDTLDGSQTAPRAVDYRALGLRSLLHLPVIDEGGLLGVLRVGAAAPFAFDEDDMTVAREVADQLAIALRSAGMREQLEQERALLTRRVAERTADLSAANAELARATRLKDEFLANMSHELRTPLNAILGRSEILREKIYGPLTAKQDGAIQSIEEASRHLLSLINDILDLSKVEAGMLQLEPSAVEIESLGRAVMRMVVQVALSKRVALTTSYDSLGETLFADERRLKQILVNLLANAVKFTPAGGRVGLEVRGDREAQTMTFTVWDTGIGIAPEDQARLFRPFVQLDSALNRQQEGTGLGLALVQRLAELHGGSVILESAVGVGSRFHVVLPWLRATPLLDADVVGGTPLGAPRRALVIDDSPSAVEQIVRYLHALGSEVVVHVRAEGAVEQAASVQPDLIVLDILLPEQSGWEVLRELKADARTAAMPVLVVSVVDDPVKARALGAGAALVKPITREGFVQALQTLRAPVAEEAKPVQLALVVAPGAGAEPPLVLLAEDNAANVRVIVDYLEAVGYAVAVACNGAEAVALAEERRPAVILMDIQMPVMDGLEATRRIRAAGLADTPIVAVTALAMPGDRERCLEAGADEYLTKPLKLMALRGLIERLLGGRSPSL